MSYTVQKQTEQWSEMMRDCVGQSDDIVLHAWIDARIDRWMDGWMYIHENVYSILSI